MNCFYKMLSRFASTYTRKMRKQEELKDIVFQYAGKSVKRADRVYGWGCSATGAIGRKTLLKPEKHQKLRTKQFVPLKLDFFAEHGLQPLKIACGYGTSIIICQNKRTDEYIVYACGLNTDSQLGYHEYPRRSGRILDMLIEWSAISLPLKNPNSTKITHVACGRAHTIIATNQEGLFSLGNNSHGQCARVITEGEVYRGSQRIGYVPFNGNEIKQLICGQDHSLILTESGKVYTCGLGADGQTGLGHYNNVDKFTLVEGEISGEKIIHISSKADTTLAVDESGEVFGWGNSEYNQLGPDVEMQINSPICLNLKNLVGRVLAASAAGSSCALLNEKGNVYTWGFGALGQGPSASSSSEPLLIPPQLFGLNEYISKISSNNTIKNINTTKNNNFFNASKDNINTNIENKFATTKNNSATAEDNTTEYINSTNDYTNATTKNKHTIEINCAPTEDVTTKKIKYVSIKGHCTTPQNNSSDAITEEKFFTNDIPTENINTMNMHNSNISTITENITPERNTDSEYNATNVDASFITRASATVNDDVIGRIVDIDCGLHYFAALTNTGDLYTWGKNRHATLGLAHEKDQYFPFKVQVPAEVKSIGCGVDHMIVLCKSFT